jgi:hypothetical protein
MDQQHRQPCLFYRSMSVRRKTIWTLCFTVMVSWSRAGAQQDPRDVFVTFAVNEGSAVPKPSQVEGAFTAKESRPADHDPEGNWGEASNGAQLSVRFDRTVFRLGEPVLANVFLRNVTNTPLSHGIPRGTGFDSSLCRLIVTGPGDQPTARVEQPSFRGFSGSVRNAALYPKAQWKSPVCLNNIFKMDEPGTYFVTGLTGAGNPAAEIRTRTVAIEVVANDSTASPTDAAGTLRNGFNKPITHIRADDNTTTVPGSISQPTSVSASSSRIASSALDISNEPASAALTVATASTTSNTHALSPQTCIGIIAGLLALVLVILWRAARRKPEV